MKTSPNSSHSVPHPDLLDPHQYRQLLDRLPVHALTGEQIREMASTQAVSPLWNNDSDRPSTAPSLASQASVPPVSSRSQYGTASKPMVTQESLRYVQYIVAGGCILAALALMADVQSLMPTARPQELCQTVLQPDAILSRAHLAQLLAISERSPKTAIRQVITEPYCQLPTLELRAGVQAEREAYPLEFDPDTWLVVLYEGDEYAGFDFSFRR